MEILGTRLSLHSNLLKKKRSKLNNVEPLVFWSMELTIFDKHELHLQQGVNTNYLADEEG